MEKVETYKEDFVTRSYQSDIMDIALKQNTIIYLPTGSGKTYIAILLIKQLSKDIIKDQSEGSKITVFLVNAVALVEQHYITMKRHTDFDVGKFSGDMGVDNWSKNNWDEQLSKYEVIVLTAQIFLDIIRHGYLNIDRVNLLIMDECHQAVENHPMRQIMQLFVNVPKINHPRILGLTATLLNSNCKPRNVENLVKDLEVTLHSKVATVRQLREVLGFSTNPKESIVHFEDNVDTPLILKIESMLNGLCSFLKSIKLDEATPVRSSHLKPLNPENKSGKSLANMIDNITFHMRTIGLYGAWKAALFYLITFERMKRQTDENFFIKILCLITTNLTAVMKLFEDEMKSYNEIDKIQKYLTPQMLQLIDILKSFKGQLCGIVFVQRRITAKIIYYVLKALVKYSDDFKHITPDFLVGLNANPSEKENIESLYSNKMSKRVMRAFCEGDINLLIASNVVEEGVDIPRCTLVVKFDCPINYRSYIQSKGRARHIDSKYIMMVPIREAAIFNEKYQSYQLIEKILENYLIGRNEDRSSPSEHSIQRQLYEDIELPPYYINGPNSPHVSELSAISLLNRYCQSLSRDKYCTPAPNWYIKENDKENEENKFVVVIEMPVMCPLREPIHGEPMSNRISAKRAAALTVCILLHKCGELNDHLLPQTEVTNIEEDYDYLFKNWIKEIRTPDSPKPGTKKMIRPHHIDTPEFLLGKQLTYDQEIYLHLIDIQPSFGDMTENEYNLRMQYELMKSNLSYGLLTAKKLPKLCDFPLYISAGELSIHIEVNVCTIVLNKKQFDILRAFNTFVFAKVLNVLKTFLTFDNSEDSGTVLIVPLNKEEETNNYTIAFKIAEELTIMNPVVELTASQKKAIVVTDESYLGHIVCPWYRLSEIQYIVTRVCHELSALSPFPSNDFDSYVHYYDEKYNIKIENPTQPLLLVKAIAKKLNWLKPRSATLYGKRSRQQMNEGFEEHLIAEMCTLQIYPASLWYKSYCIPSILHRLMLLLNAEELRQKINRDMKIGVIELPKDINWEPLLLDKALLKIDDKKPQPVPQRNVAEGDVIALPAPEIRNTNIPVNKDYARKMLEKQYPWTDEQEPIDIERNIEEVRLMEIVDFERFISNRVFTSSFNMDDSDDEDINQTLAIMPNESYEFKPIKMLINKQNDIGPQLWQMYQTLMSAKADDIVNFERLETLGDSFLKVSISLYLFSKYPQYNEGRLSNIKGKIIGNRNLFYVGKNKNLGGLMKFFNFVPDSEWMPPGYHVPKILQDKIKNKKLQIEKLFEFEFTDDEINLGDFSPKKINEIEEKIKTFEEEDDISDTEEKYSSMNRFLKIQNVPDKAVSDCVEALIGVYLQSNGVQGGLALLEWLEILPETEHAREMFNTKPPSPFFNDEVIEKHEIDLHLPDYRKIEQHLGYTFKNRGYLLQALTHASYTSIRITDCYQRLEFLGDAVLDFLVTCHIYEISHDLTPGQLTDLRSALVNNVTFAGLSVRNGFHKHLKSMNTKLLDVIDTFVRYQEERNFVINEEILILNEDGPDRMMAEHVHVPKVLGDLFEALAGAVFLDSGLDLQETWRVFHKIMWREIDLFRANVPKSPVRLLYECSSAAPHFDVAKLIGNGITMVDLAVIVEGKRQVVHGFGENKQQAKRAAAKLALRLLNKNK